MKIRKFVIGVLIIFTVSFSGLYAQNTKIGYCNLELILRLMPETAAMDQELNLYRQKYSERLATKEKLMQDKYAEATELLSKVPPAITEEEAKKREEELMKLQEEIKSDAERYERELAERQEKLLDPIVEKLKIGLDELAVAEGYTYILNSMDASGTSIVLKGPKEDDLTEKLMKKFNLSFPNQTPKTNVPPTGTSTPLPPAGNK